MLTELDLKDYESAPAGWHPDYYRLSWSEIEESPLYSKFETEYNTLAKLDIGFQMTHEYLWDAYPICFNLPLMLLQAAFYKKTGNELLARSQVEMDMDIWDCYLLQELLLDSLTVQPLTEMRELFYEKVRMASEVRFADYDFLCKLDEDQKNKLLLELIQLKRNCLEHLKKSDEIDNEQNSLDSYCDETAKKLQKLKNRRQQIEITIKTLDDCWFGAGNSLNQ